MSDGNGKSGIELLPRSVLPTPLVRIELLNGMTVTASTEVWVGAMLRCMPPHVLEACVKMVAEGGGNVEHLK